MSRFLISCGGTGGHLSPGIALAEGLIGQGHEALLLISEKKVDARLVAKYPQLQFVRSPGTGFGWQPLRLARFAGSQLRGLFFCGRLIRRWRPDGIVGFGGFSSAAVVAAGRLLGVPLALHEANRVPGRATRALGRLAERVYLPPGIRLRSVRASRTRQMGLPVRREILPQPQTEARRSLGLDPDRRVLVVLGGSQGSSTLNDWVREHLADFAAEGVQVYCVTGLGKGREEILERRTGSGERIAMRFVPFSDRIADLLSAADLVVSRAGAGTLAELVRCATPAILVPFPQAADDHQRANAAFFERQGGGLMVGQDAMITLYAEVRKVLFNDWLLRQFHLNLQRMDRANSLEVLLRDLEEIALPHSSPPFPVTI